MLIAIRRVAWVLVVVVGVLLALGGYTFYRTGRIEAQFPPIGSFATVDGVPMHYLDVPADDLDAPVIVFIHGASGNLQDPMFAFRAPLAGRYRLIFVDRPGHGYSARGDAGNSAPRAQAHAIFALIRTLGIEKAVVVGHSWRAAVAAAFAVDYPKVTAGLMLLAPASHPWPGDVDWYYHLATMPVVGQVFARTIVLPAAELLVTASLKDVFGPTPLPPAYQQRAATALVFRPQEFIANADDLVHLRANVVERSPHYREIATPTVIFTGDKDTVVRPDLHAEALAREIPGARLITLKNAGHMPQFADPTAVLGALEILAGGARVRGFAAR